MDIASKMPGFKWRFVCLLFWDIIVFKSCSIGNEHRAWHMLGKLWMTKLFLHLYILINLLVKFY